MYRDITTNRYYSNTIKYKKEIIFFIGFQDEEELEFNKYLQGLGKEES